MPQPNLVFGGRSDAHGLFAVMVRFERKRGFTAPVGSDTSSWGRMDIETSPKSGKDAWAGAAFSRMSQVCQRES